MTQSDKRQHWADIISQHANSGISVADFCQQHQIAEHTFYYWRKKFSDKPATTLHPILLQETTPNQTASVNVHFPNGLRIELPAALPLGQLQTWLKALQC